MKSLLFSLLALGVFFSCDHEILRSKSDKETISIDQISTAVQQAFAATYPNTKVEWEAEDDGTFEAEFEMDGEEASANYSATGQLLEIEVEIKKKAVPEAMLAALAVQFPDHKIEEAARITYPDGRIAYEAELEGKNDKKFDAIFSADGTLLKRIELGGENDKD